MHKIINTFWSQTPRLFKLILVSVLAFTVLMVVLRIAFWIIFKDPSDPISSHDFWMSMWLGFRFDLRVAMLSFFALYLLGGFKWLSPFTSLWHRYVWLVYLTTFFSIVLMFYVIDFGHYAYLHTRVDFNALRFLENFAISQQMVWESYPVAWITLAVIAIIAMYAYLQNKVLKYYSKQEAANFHWWAGVLSFVKALILTLTFKKMAWTEKTWRFWKATAIGFVSFFIVFIMIQSKMGQYPLRWSDAAFSEKPFAVQLTYHPMHYFLDTWKNGRVTYDKKKTQKYYDVVADFLAVDHKDKNSLNFNRKVSPVKTLGDKPNVVLIIVESFASYKTSMSGNPLNPTPYAKKMADEGYYFKNFFTPSTGTARSIWTTITGIADTEMKGTSSRNPLIVDQHSVANEFKGYEKFYFLGGSASWGNIRGILSKNIDGLHLKEKGAYRFSDVDVWGISDLDLFIEANDVFKKQTKPFFSIIQTSGDHRPYTIPDDSHDFKLVTDIDTATLNKYGFESLEELNSYRFMDHSIGYFMKLLEKEDYAKNTIFAFWGDHGINGNPEHVAKEDKISTLALGSLRVPFVIWAPGLIKKPLVLDTPASEVDGLPTLAALAGQSYIETTFGRDLFNPKYAKNPYAFTVQQMGQQQIGLIGEKFYYQMFKDKPGKLHKLYSDDPLKDHQASYPDIAKKMRELTMGLLEAMQYKAHHNKAEQAIIPK